MAAASFGTFAIGVDLTNSVILAGANLGNDFEVGGTGEDADTFGPGSITKFTVGGQAAELDRRCGPGSRGRDVPQRQ